LTAIILAGGFGTRLREVIKDVPKPMADINGKPFLEILLRYLKKRHPYDRLLSVGYKQEVIVEYFKDSFAGIDIIYTKEDKPLGTGGAIKRALEKIDDTQVFVLNGDTFFDIDLEDMKNFHLKSCADITISLKKMKNFDRYGSVILDKNRVLKFKEKRFVKSGYINGGIYILKTDILKDQEDIFSLKNIYLKRKKLFMDIKVIDIL